MEVWQEIAKNAEHGAERLVAEYGDRLYAAATLLCRNNGDAEELVFTTLAQAVGKIRQYSPSGDFFSWLYTILLNFYRMEGRKNRPDIVLVGSPQDLPQIPVGKNNDAAEEMREMVRQLPPQIRETVILKYFSGMSIEEIATTLGIPPGTEFLDSIAETHAHPAPSPVSAESSGLPHSSPICFFSSGKKRSQILCVGENEG